MTFVKPHPKSYRPDLPTRSQVAVKAAYSRGFRTKFGSLAWVNKLVKKREKELKRKERNASPP